MLDPQQSRNRQKRLLDLLQQRRLDAAVIGETKNVYYFNAHMPHWLQQAVVVLAADGTATLVAADKAPSNVAADEIITYEGKRMSTQRQEQPHAAAAMALTVLKKAGAKRIGVDASAATSQVLLAHEGQAERLDDDIFQMRRRKDADELGLMRKATDCAKAMHRRARQMIAPGVAELEVFAELHAAAVKEAGEPLSDRLGNDYACGVPGGPPRTGRVATAGQLYILDLGPAYRGYFSDNCRTYSVDRLPTDKQLDAWQAVADAFPIIERMAKPGVRCQEIFQAADQHFRDRRGTGMPHHLGHGVGLQPHEYPHLNPKWDDVLLEGEVFSAEPGQYAPELAAGIRLENTYVVTKTGVENLLADVPLELV
jgi:Xaa-Pro dipeptidase